MTLTVDTLYFLSCPFTFGCGYVLSCNGGSTSLKFRELGLVLETFFYDFLSYIFRKLSINHSHFSREPTTYARWCKSLFLFVCLKTLYNSKWRSKGLMYASVYAVYCRLYASNFLVDFARLRLTLYVEVLSILCIRGVYAHNVLIVVFQSLEPQRVETIKSS